VGGGGRLTDSNRNGFLTAGIFDSEADKATIRRVGSANRLTERARLQPTAQNSGRQSAARHRGAGAKLPTTAKTNF